MSKLISEIKRRRVFKVATAYLIGGWIIVQIADVLREPLEMPNWVFLAILGALALGFVVTVALAWTFDLTPDGVKRTPGEAANQIQSLSTGRKIDFVIIGLLVVAVIAFATKDSWFRSATDGISVAVLPFVSMSTEEDNEYFADGLSEELLNILANIDGFEVPGRTSSFYYKGRNIDLREVGQNLGVDNILEGSVRRSGDKVRITAQLIRTKDGYHIWSDTYDKSLNDIFGIQEDVARSVARALRVRLLGEDEDELAQRWVADPKAHNKYIVARSRQNQRGQENLVSAISLYENIIAEHPDFAPAYSGQAESILLVANNHFIFADEDAVDRAKPLVDKALELAPESAASWRAKGFLDAQIHKIRGGDNGYFDTAQADFERALSLDPKDANTLYWYGILLDDAGHRERAVELYQRSLKTDPLARVPRYRLAQIYGQLGEYDRARRELTETLELYPDYNAAVSALGNLEFNAGNYRDAEKYMLDAVALESDVSSWANLFTLYLNASDTDAAMQSLSRMDLGVFTEDAVALLAAVMAGDKDNMVKYANALADGENTTPQWLQLSAIVNLFAGNDEEARARLDRQIPGIFEEVPELDQTTAYPAVLAAAIMLRDGNDEFALELLDAAEATHKKTWPDYQPIPTRYRLAEIAALRGDNETATALLTSVYEQGFRQPWFDVMYPVSENPMFSGLVGDPAFEDFHLQIDADIEDLRQTLVGPDRVL